ncbi:MAG: PTS sugar transporter subunit IIB [candidate division KSB1 bacterium]|nr:PTS sugar transporter subunit IIB [candidate division KSB1 bacterium]MDZ7334141.1 PTS sugar transporter subunit IIB [candidate division KSB1 bacterium]MDZ7357389.1 PTS sugar transporter subunit IIB [candidate division KSB1 bacterium]MDZ7377193.1 PTS sugar transporter subunit IIB [candidate division KSB1 bacterium]MDZ7401363.1 PTS sugar transporter subunit IIB [candidate division KSB1 bacterium]
MPLVLVRIDDRLIHGQVVVGWGLQLKPDRIVLCNDAIAESPWEREIYMGTEASAPYPLKVSVLSIQETVQLIQDDEIQRERIILLVETPQDVLELAKAGLEIKKINVGGMHYRPGKRRIAPYIFVDDEDIACFKAISAMKIELEGKEVPGSKSINIIQAIGAIEQGSGT